MSYLHGLYLDSFQTTKRHSYDGYSIYIAIFNSFHEAVYPVGVTTNRSCFTRIIGNNSRTIHRICTKFDARIRLWTSFLCAKFQGDRSTRLRFIAIFASVRKHARRKKNEENFFFFFFFFGLRNKKKNRSFGSSYLGNGWSDFLQIWNVDFPGWRTTL